MTTKALGCEARLLGATDDAGDLVAGEDVGQVLDRGFGRWAKNLHPWQRFTQYMLALAADAVALDLDQAP